MNSCDLILRMLARSGVKEVFGIPGDAINTLVEALRQQEAVQFIQVRHEEAGAFAASAQAKLGRAPGVCVGTAGPGAVHLLNGLYDAAKDGAPVLAITGQVPTFQLGTSSHQELDLHHLFDDVCVFNEVVDSPRQVREVMEQAIRTAVDRGGVSHVNLPEDVANAKVDGDVPTDPLPAAPSRLAPSAEAIDAAARTLGGAGHPVILAGVGSRGAVGPLVRVAQRLGAPIIQTLRAKDLLPEGHPWSVGGLGLLGGRPAVEAMNRADALLMVGTDFPYREFYPRGLPVVQIDVEASHVGRRIPVETALIGHAEPTLEALLERLPDRQRPAPAEDEGLKIRLWRSWMERQEQDRGVPIKPQALARRIGELAPDETIYCCDTGAVTAWCARHLPIREGQRFTLSANLASMAFALPGAIGVQLAWPERPVVALCGDGGLTMLMSEFITAVKYELPITVIVFNNGKLGLIEVEQHVSGYPHFQTDLPPFDFAAFARLSGGMGARVATHDELDAALSQATVSDSPWIVDVEIDPDEMLFPPRLDVKEAIGFGLSKLRALFERNGDDS
jgi:thiamine pyrophosphate-dependent acetolactate synthase large subunit-like protein